MSHQDKAKKLVSEYDRLMVKGVRAEAIRLKTGCVHFEPFEIAEDTSPCPLHMDTNEYLRVLEHIVKISASLTLTHFCEAASSRFTKYFGKRKVHGTDCPNISKVSAESPLAKVVELLRHIKMKKFADYFTRQYTPPLIECAASGICIEEELGDDYDLVADIDEVLGMEHSGSNGSNAGKRIRMIGESVLKLSPKLVLFVRCLKPSNGEWPSGQRETSQELKQRLICHSYVHVVRALSAMLSSWTLIIFQSEHGMQLLGDLFVLLVHRFKLHKSYNTFLMAQVSPFKVKRNLFRYTCTHSE